MPPKKQKLRIHKWDPAATLKPTQNIIVIGKRNTGKSVIVNHLAWILRNQVQFGVVFSPTAAAQGAFTFVPASCIHEEYSGGVVQGIMDLQRRQWRRSQGGSHGLVILDDVAYDKKIFSDRGLRNLYMNGRHCRLGSVLALQYALDLPTYLRVNADIVIAAAGRVGEPGAVYKNFFGLFEPTRASPSALTRRRQTTRCSCSATTRSPTT